VEPLIPFLPPFMGNQNPVTIACEPCAGRGALVDAIEPRDDVDISFTVVTDIEPRRDDIGQADALNPDENFQSGVLACDMIITNPPWDRKFLHPFIDLWAPQIEMWLLFDADWAHTLGAAPRLEYCADIVSVGRVSWEQNGVSGFDNCAWYHFLPDAAFTVFHGRAQKSKHK